jgi:hypothetical protein
MPDEPLLREKARDALRCERLPRGAPDVIYGGPSRAARCGVCEEPILRGDLEIELVFGRFSAAEKAHHLHVRCHAAWELERTKDHLIA